MNFFVGFFSQNFFGRFDTSGSMIACLVPDILPLDAFCDVGVGVVGVVVGIGDSRSWMSRTPVQEKLFVDKNDGKKVDHTPPIEILSA